MQGCEMSDVMVMFGLVMVAFVAVVVMAGAWIRFLVRENRRLQDELVLGYRRATMPVLGVPEAGEPDVPLTAEVKKAIDEAYGFNAGVVDYGQFAASVAQAFGAAGYPDPTDGLLPNPDPTDGANRVSYGDDPSWPFQPGGQS